MRSRIDDVARLAGVSLKTVSRVLNREPNVRDSTRERVEAAVKELNYRPQQSARSLAGRRSYQIALLYDNPSANYLMEVQAGILAACEAWQYTLTLRPVSFDDPDFVNGVETFLHQFGPDGVVLTPPITDHAALLARLDQLGMPYASVSTGQDDGHPGVVLDERRAAADIVRHLIGLGHCDIAHIQGHPAHRASEWRLQGYHDALNEAGLPYRSDRVLPGEFSFASGVAAGKQLLALQPRPTAVFAGNDDTAAGVIHVAYEQGLAVPAQLSVCGFDDTPISQQVYPSLTTVRQPSRDMGRLAAEQLLQNLTGRGSSEHVLIPYSLQIRSSTGPAPKR